MAGSTTMTLVAVFLTPLGALGLMLLLAKVEAWSIREGLGDPVRAPRAHGVTSAGQRASTRVRTLQ